MNTFVTPPNKYLRGRTKNLYRVATYVKARNSRISQFKCLSGFLSFEDACQRAQEIAWKGKGHVGI